MKLCKILLVIFKIYLSNINIVTKAIFPEFEMIVETEEPIILTEKTEEERMKEFEKLRIEGKVYNN